MKISLLLHEGSNLIYFKFEWNQLGLMGVSEKASPFAIRHATIRKQVHTSNYNAKVYIKL